MAERNATTPFTTITQKLDTAAGQIQDFITKNAGDAKGNEAKMALGSLHSGFVQWCADLVDLDDDWRKQRDKEKEDNKGAEPVPVDPAAPKELGPLESRGAAAAAVRAAAADSNRKAEEIFADLKVSSKTDNDKQLAEFSYLTALYYKGLTFEKCKSEAVTAFQNAKKQLEDYAFANEQYITGTYALDFLGKTSQELADCENDPKLQLNGYRAALENFLAAANAGDQGDEHRKLMCTGFLHIAQLGIHLADRNQDSAYRTTVLKSADLELAKLVKQPWLKKYKQGLYGMIAWAEFQALAFDKKGEAIDVLRQASDAAASIFDDVKRRADGALRRLVKMGGGGGEAIDVGIVIKVADDLYANGKFADAVPAYQKVVAGSGKDRESLVKYYLYGWSRIGACYVQLKLPVEAAAAFDVIADELRAGRAVPTSQEDAVGKIMMDAFTKERAALRDLSERTGDPAAKKRLDAFTDWVIRATAGIPAGKDGGGGSDLAYGRALETFKGALKKRDEAQNGPEWRTMLKDSLQFFEQTGSNFKSEYQDVAWVYVVRVAYEAGEWDGVATAADRALAFWDSPESKKRAAAEEKIGTNRKAQVAAVAYWKAAAFVGAKKDDAAMPILEGFKAQYGRDASFYLGWAMGMRVEILLRRSNIEAAESSIDELIREFPDYHKLPAILAQQAEYYRGKELEIQKQIDDVVAKDIGTPANRAAGKKQQLKAAILDETNLVNVISDLLGVIERAGRVIAADPLKVTEIEKARAKKEKEAAEAKLRDTRARLDKLRAEMKTLESERADLQKQKTKLLTDQVGPLRKTAELYRKLDIVFKDLDAKSAGGPKKRKPENVSVLAFRYYKLAKIEDTDADAWQTAKSLYEDWLAFPEIKALPEGDGPKRRAYRVLGEIYYRVASTSKPGDEQRVAYQSAVKYLEDGLARLAANTPILLGNLSSELVVLPYKVDERTWRIPVRKVADVAEFREYVKALLGGGKLPKYMKDVDQALYEKAVGAFQRRIAAMTDGELKQTVVSLKTGGFDPAFFAEHADTDQAFILALAHAYQAAGQAADAAKAINVAGVLLNGAQKLEEDSADWWEVQTLGLEVRVAAAERALLSGGPAAPDAKTYTSQAQKMLLFTKQNYPHIGGVDRHEKTLEEWAALQVRVNALAKALGLPTSTVDLKAEAAPAAPTEPENPPAPTEPAMEAPPAMDAPAGMDETPPAAPPMDETPAMDK